MHAFELAQRYRIAVEERNLDAILPMFSEDAVIKSPLKGACQPKPYHEWLFASMKELTVTIKNICQALNGDVTISIHAQYNWLLKNGEVLEFGGVTILEFTEDRKKIRSVSNFYDTFQFRLALDKANLPVELA